MMCKISHKLNTDTFQIIDPILACVTSYEELKLTSLDKGVWSGSGKSATIYIKYDKHYYTHGAGRGVNDT